MIQFGTAGWRGIIGEDFTFHNVRLVTQAIANHLLDRAVEEPALAIGYDTRFLSEKFATEAAKVLSHNRIEAVLCSRDTPSPALSRAIIDQGASGGINFTVSHNPPEYSGLKMMEATGAPALPSVTASVEAGVRAIEDDFVDEYFFVQECCRSIDAAPGYLTKLRGLVNLDAIADSGLKLAVDALYGTGRDYLDRTLMTAGIDCEVLHNFRDPYFGGYSPDPSPESLAELSQMVAGGSLDLGLALDIDADRFAIVDSDGTILNPNDVLGLVLDHLLSQPRHKGDVARTVATTHLIDRVAGFHGVEVHETPVGFKYIGDLIRQGRVVFGGEESAGLSIHDHVPEKDGILACLLVAEAAARRGAPLRRQLEKLWERVGRSRHVRRDYRLSPAQEEELARRGAEPPEALADRRVAEVRTVDGVKLLLEDSSWFLWRRSGTEHLLRCYAEAPTREEAETLHEAGRRWLFGDEAIEPE